MSLDPFSIHGVGASTGWKDGILGGPPGDGDGGGERWLRHLPPSRQGKNEKRRRHGKGFVFVLFDLASTREIVDTWPSFVMTIDPLRQPKCPDASPDRVNETNSSRFKV